MNIINYKKATDSLIRIISKSLDKEHYKYNILYSGRSLEIVSKSTSEYTRLYIRITYIGDGFAVDISSIEFDDSLRHKGLFTKIVTDLKRSRTIRELWVSSILTPEMWAACKKLGFRQAPEICGCKMTINK